MIMLMQTLIVFGQTKTWDFGNDATSDEKSPIETYTISGNYTISLMITDTNGCSDSVEKTIFLNIRN